MPGDPAVTVVLRDVDSPVPIAVEPATRVTLRNVFPVVKERMSP